MPRRQDIQKVWNTAQPQRWTAQACKTCAKEERFHWGKSNATWKARNKGPDLLDKTSFTADVQGRNIICQERKQGPEQCASKVNYM